MQRELDQTVKAKVKENVIEALIASQEVEVPSALIDQEVNALRDQAKQRFAQQGQADPKNLPELPAELFTDNAKRRVSIGLILGEVIKSNDLKADEEKVNALIETTASAYEDPSEVIEYYKSNQELMSQMQNVALEEQAIDWVLAQAKVKEVKEASKDRMQEILSEEQLNKLKEHHKQKRSEKK